MTGTTAILGDTLEEGRRLLDLFDGARVRARLLGGAGIALHGHRELPSVFRRSYGDLDFVVRRRDAAAFRKIVGAAGYDANERFNALHGHRRLLYYDAAHGRQIDAFVGDFRMCHALDLDDRLPDGGPSIAPADLLLTKLQIVEINDKDLLDVLALLADHPPGDLAGETIERGRISAVLGTDWGWHTTVSDNLARLADRLEHTPELGDELGTALRRSINELVELAATAPKSIGWRIRARVGRRIAWYELPEEVGR